MDQAAQPRPNARSCADKQRDRADDRAEGLAVKQIGRDGGIKRLPGRKTERR